MYTAGEGYWISHFRYIHFWFQSVHYFLDVYEIMTCYYLGYDLFI